MTKILLITNKFDITTDFIVNKLRESNVEFYRFNTDELTKSVSISIDIKNRAYQLFDNARQEQIDLKEFTSVYFRRPELPIISINNVTPSEAQFIRNEIFYSLEGLYKLLNDIYWISPIYSIREAENKIYQLEVAQQLGLEIPETLISNSYDSSKHFYLKNDKDCIVKPLNTGLLENENDQSILFTSIIEDFPYEQESIASCPHLIQKHIRKKADIRVTVVGDKVFATMIHSQEIEDTRIDWRKGEQPIKHSKIKLPATLESQCILMLKHLGLKFGAIDFILDEKGDYIFLEINPNGQWAWIENQTGYDIAQAIVNLLRNEHF